MNPFWRQTSPHNPFDPGQRAKFSLYRLDPAMRFLPASFWVPPKGRHIPVAAGALSPL